MTKRGPKPKPTALLKLQGTYREDRHGKRSEPQLPSIIPDAPAFLKGLALDEWHKITALLAEANCITQLDHAMLTAYCLEFERYIIANKRLGSARTMLTKSTKGTKLPHPLIRISNGALANMLRICSEFGLTPSARTRLNIEAASGAVDPLDSLIRQQIELREKRKFFDGSFRPQKTESGRSPVARKPGEEGRSETKTNDITDEATTT